MAGTRKAGLEVAAKLKAQDPDYYRKLGLLSAESYRSKPKNQRKPRGFAHNKDLAVLAGRKGGRISRRGERRRNKK